MIKVNSVQTNQKRQYRNLTAAVGVGAVAGGLSRYILPSKNEAKSLFNKQNIDTFISNEAVKNRGNRSILKYAGIGALIAGAVELVANAVKKNKPENAKNEEYTKLGALLDAPDYACEIMWWGE